MSVWAASLSLVAVLAAAPLADAVPAQSLGEAAARERRRREKEKKAGEAKPPAPAYTNEDLEGEGKEGEEGAKAEGGAGEGAGEARTEGGTEGSSEGAVDPGSGSGGEAYWRQRADEARRAVADAERTLADAEARAARLRQDLDPLTGLGDPNRLQTLAAERARARADVEEASNALAGARRALGSLEEEARRQNVPPGWLRER